MASNPRKSTPGSSLAVCSAGVKSGEPNPGEELTPRLAGKPPGPGTVLVALSGGGDSVALLRLLAALAQKRRWRLVAAHVDHGLRPDSPKDAEFCRKLAAKLSLAYLERRMEVKTAGRSLEEAARQVRHHALSRMAAACGAGAIALGHTADDQAETLLSRLLTGTGPTGLAGMRPNSGLLWRPLIFLRRQELREYLRALGQKWRQDPSNQTLGPLRNRVRLKLLPLAEELVNPQAVEALGRLAALCAQEEDHWTLWYAKARRRIARREGTSLCIKAESLQKMDQASLRRFLRLAVGEITQSGQHLLSYHVDQLMELLAGRPGRQLTLPGGLWAGRENGILRLDPVPERIDLNLRLDGPGCVQLPEIGKTLLIEPAPAPEELTARGETAWLPADRVRWPLQVRSPQKGERFRPMGAPGSKLLSRFFIDQKVSLWWRRRAVVVADQRGIWWVGPWSVAERARKKGAESAWLRLLLIDTPKLR